MNVRAIRLFLAVTVLFCGVDAFAAARTAQTRVLFIGNSLTFFNEMPWIAERVAESLRVEPPLHTDFSGGSGASLRQQWERGRAVRAIRQGRFDYVVLQPQSAEILRKPEETFRYAKLLDGEIRRAGAKTVLFLTWAPLESRFSQEQYTNAYVRLGRELGATIAPVGIAWEALRDAGIELFDGSGLHANLAGSYLTACVFVSLLYGRSPENAVHEFDVRFDIEESYRQALVNERLSAATAAKIQRAAWSAVRARRGRAR